MTMMPFGKYQDWPFDEIPYAYLAWARDNLDLREELARAIEAELEERRLKKPRRVAVLQKKLKV